MSHDLVFTDSSQIGCSVRLKVIHRNAGMTEEGWEGTLSSRAAGSLSELSRG
ncbi:MAG: hypothetical protein ACK5NN_14040 [Sphingomonadaceae bacterium]